MINKYTLTLLSFFIIAIISGCSTTSEKTSEPTVTTESAPIGGRYPTHDRLDYMYKCIQKHSSQQMSETERKLLTEPCSCKIDKIEQKLSFSDYEKAKTFTNLSRQAGDNGAAFRDPAQSKDLRKKLKVAEAEAEKSCFVGK